MKTLVLGLGNPILCDDGAGIRVAQAVREGNPRPGVTVLESSLSGLDLLDLITGYDKLILVDAIQTKDGVIGQIHRLTLADFAFTLHSSSPHNTNLATALELGKRLGMAVPGDIVIFAIEVKDVVTFKEECTPEVEAAIPAVVDMVLQELSLPPGS